MERAEYEKFLKLWRDEGVNGYYLQSTDEPNHSYIDHSKIRKDGTVYASEWEKENLPHNGIWLDIFPLDKVPTEEKKRKKYLNKNKFRMIYTRGYPLKGRGIAYYLITKLLLIGTRKSQLRKRNKLDEYIKSTMNIKNGFEYKSLACVDDLKLTYPSDLMNEYTTIKFGEYEFSVVKDYDLMLKITFGDYMSFPPEEERVCKHKPKYVEF
jgi:lipopolysaccharide cholinephosphotransferase